MVCVKFSGYRGCAPKYPQDSSEAIIASIIRFILLSKGFREGLGVGVEPPLLGLALPSEGALTGDGRKRTHSSASCM